MLKKTRYDSPATISAIVELARREARQELADKIDAAIKSRKVSIRARIRSRRMFAAMMAGYVLGDHPCSDCLPPACISRITRLKVLSIGSDRSRICGVYFLCDGEKVVYVGASRNISVRVKLHAVQQYKKFDRAYFILCPESELSDTERNWIDLLLPIYNTDIHSSVLRVENVALT